MLQDTLWCRVMKRKKLENFCGTNFWGFGQNPQELVPQKLKDARIDVALINTFRVVHLAESRDIARILARI